MCQCINGSQTSLYQDRIGFHNQESEEQSLSGTCSRQDCTLTGLPVRRLVICVASGDVPCGFQVVGGPEVGVTPHSSPHTEGNQWTLVK